MGENKQMKAGRQGAKGAVPNQAGGSLPQRAVVGRLHGSADFQAAQRRRAENQFWLGCGNYSASCPQLSFRADGTADLYANLASGLIVRHFGDALRTLQVTWEEDYRAERFNRVAWLAYESAAFALERPNRPVLEDLRAAYAQDMDPADSARARKLQCGGYTPAQVDDCVRRALRAWYGFDGRVVRAPQATLHLGLALLGFAKRGQKSKEREGKLVLDAGHEGKVRAAGHRASALQQALANRARQRALQDRAYIQKCFGAPLCSEATLAKLEQQTCVGAHEGCHLWLADGAAPVGSVSGREFRAMQGSAEDQFAQNRAYYDQHRRVFDAAAAHLAQMLSDRLRYSGTFREKRRKRGVLDGSTAWRVDVLGDEQVFTRLVRLDNPPLCVDILLDASGSRADQRKEVAAQAYIIGKGLAACGIAVRVTAFSSVRGYTVLRRFNEYGDAFGLSNVFRYFAAGMNRDGLALAAAGALCGVAAHAGSEERTFESYRHVMLVLTDAAPMDTYASVRAENEVGRTSEYNGATAVDDAAKTVRHLRGRGIGVAAVFDGEDAFEPHARTIYGNQFVRVRSIKRMADACASLIADML